MPILGQQFFFKKSWERRKTMVKATAVFIVSPKPALLLTIYTAFCCLIFVLLLLAVDILYLVLDDMGRDHCLN